MMIRKQLYIEPRQDRELKRLARQNGKTEAEIVREAINRLIQEKKQEANPAKAWRETEAFIEQWIARGPVPASRRRWRREDLYDRKCLTGH